MVQLRCGDAAAGGRYPSKGECGRSYNAVRKGDNSLISFDQILGLDTPLSAKVGGISVMSIFFVNDNGSGKARRAL